MSSVLPLSSVWSPRKINVRHAVCCNCGEPEHCRPSGVCDKPAKCVNCSGDHPANSKQCPQWEKEKKIIKIKCENNLSFPDARKQNEQFYTGPTYASAANPGTCNKSTQTDNKSTQTGNSFTEYLKQQTTEKAQGTQENRNSSPHPGKSNSSHPGPALKAATLEMMKKDEEKKRKEEKDKLEKNYKKKKENRSISKKKHRKIKKTLKKQNNLKRIYILCLVKMMKIEMEDNSVVFTEPSSSDHLLIGTLSRLPITSIMEGFNLTIILLPLLILFSSMDFKHKIIQWNCRGLKPNYNEV